MENVDELCFSCMNRKGNEEFCNMCGFNNNTYEPPMHHLKPGTILNGKYILGKSLGEGGFGITYIGYDINLEIRVAIKEYFPGGFVSRDTSNTDTVTIFSGSDKEIYDAGKAKFINEAKALAKFDNMPGIVSVKDFFLENGTAYIVMEYVDGETLKEYLKHSGDKISADKVFEMMKPLMDSLAKVHKQGIIHRDISPDNIMLTKDMEVKLLDFGAARDISGNGQKSLSVQLKPGYAPEEQYRSHGEQGPWTDVYALCATMYRAMTGNVPEEALERMQNDTLSPPSALGVAIDPNKEQVLMRGLAVYAQQRIQDMETLYNALFYGGAVPQQPIQQPMQQPIQQPMLRQSNTRPNKSVIAAVAVCAGVVALALAVMAVSILVPYIKKGKESEPVAEEVATETIAEPTQHPAPIMTNVSASSTRGTDSEGGTYSKEAILTDDPTSKWVPGKSHEEGIGQWVELSADTTQYVSGIKVLNGYHKNSETWRNNNRVKLCRVSFSDGSEKEFILDDTMDMITLNFGEVIPTTSVRVTIGSVYYGAKWNDTAITYVGVY